MRNQNQLYSELLEKSIQLQNEVDASKNKVNTFHYQPQTNIFIENTPNKSQNPGETQSNGQKREHNVDPTISLYLKRTMLQFFLQYDSKKDELIPMILELVGCNQQQISAAQRQWARSHQLFSRTSFFGFGK